MESRKRRNLEIERKRKLKQRIFTMVVTVLILAVVGGGGYLFYNWFVNIRPGGTMVSFDGGSIAIRDFRFFNMIQEQDMGPEFALERLTEHIVAAERAAGYGISLSDEELGELLEMAAGMRESWNQVNPGMLNFISDQEIAAIWAAEDIFSRLFEYLMDEYPVDESEFNEMIEEMMDVILEMVTEQRVKYIISFEGPENLLAASAMFEETGDFDAVIRAHDEFHREGDEIEAVSLHSLLEEWSLHEFFDELEALEDGEISGVFEVNLVHFLVYMHENAVNEEFKEMLIERDREQYLSFRREERFFEKVQEWIDEANVSVNERALRRFM